MSLATRTAASMISGALQLKSSAAAPRSSASRAASATVSPERSTGTSCGTASSSVNDSQNGLPSLGSTSRQVRASASDEMVSASQMSTYGASPATSGAASMGARAASNRSGRYEPNSGGSDPATFTSRPLCVAASLARRPAVAANVCASSSNRSPIWKGTTA